MLTPYLHIYTYTDMKTLFCIIQQLLEMFMNFFAPLHILTYEYYHDFSVPVDWVWIGSWIIELFDTAHDSTLQFTVTHTHTH
jgi:hypothetical protein